MENIQSHMIVVLDDSGYYVSTLLQPREIDFDRFDVFNAPYDDKVQSGLSRLVDGQWIHPPAHNSFPLPPGQSVMIGDQVFYGPDLEGNPE